MRVQEIMTRPVRTCSVDETLNAAARGMWERDCGALPVVDEDGRLAGMITDRDVCMAAYTQGRALDQLRVSAAMTPHVLACHIDDFVETAEQLMREGQVRRIPVIDNDGRPVGIISVNDLARTTATASTTVMAHDLVETLAVICEPRVNDAETTPMRSRP